jgi:hypothetical protein
MTSCSLHKFVSAIISHTVYDVINACQKVIENGPPATYTLLNDHISYSFCFEISWLICFKHTGTQCFPVQQLPYP